MYHEASLCNFFEVLLYHRTACEAAEDALVELVDYSYRKFVSMIEQCEKLPYGTSLMPQETDHKKLLAMSP